MKKKMSIVICLMITAVLTACGTKENAEEVRPVEDTSVVETEATEVEEVEETPEADAIGITDVVIGGDAITVNDFETSRREYRLSDMPEVHIVIPDGAVECTKEEGDSMHYREYKIFVPEIGREIACRVNFEGNSDCYCGIKHEETIDYGTYLLDYNWCKVTVCNKSTDTAISIMFSAADDEGGVAEIVAYLTDMNIEYLKQQIAGWGQDFQPASDDTEENINEEIYKEINPDFGTQVYVSDNGNRVEIENFMSENTTMHAVDSVGYTYDFNMKPEADTLYFAMDGDRQALYVDIADGKLTIDTDYEDYCNLYGEYTLVEE